MIETSGGDATPKRKRSMIRLLVLVVILIAVAGMGVYQLKVSQPAYFATCTKIMEAYRVSAEESKGGFTPEEVREVIGFAPRSKDFDNGLRVEYYRWFSINLSNPLVIAVAYEKNEEGKFLVCYMPFIEQPTDAEIIAITESDNADEDGEDDEDEEEDEDEGGGGKWGGGSRSRWATSRGSARSSGNHAAPRHQFRRKTDRGRVGKLAQWRSVDGRRHRW